MDWSFFTAMAALLTSLTALYLGIANRRKTNAETTQIVTNALDQIITRLRSEIDELVREAKKRDERIDFLEAQINEQQGRIESLRGRVKELERENLELRAGVQLLTLQVTTLGATPLYPPRKPGQGETP